MQGVPIAGANQKTYTIVPADLGKALTVTVVARKPAHARGDATSLPVTVSPGSAPTATTPPSITGTGKVGQTLSSHDGTWSLPGVVVARQWLRAGKPTGGTAAAYPVTAADAGRSVTLRVTETAPGYADGTAVSAPRKVAKLASTTSVAAVKKAKAGKNATVTVKVAGSGVVRPTGKVTLYDGKKKVRTVALKAARKGVVTIQVTLRAGQHRLKAVYAGSSTVAPSTSKVLKVNVKAPAKGASR